MAERTSKYFFSQAVTPRDGPSIVEISHLVILSEVRISVWLIFLPKVFEAFPIPNLKSSGYFRSKYTLFQSNWSSWFWMKITNLLFDQQNLQIKHHYQKSYWNNPEIRYCHQLLYHNMNLNHNEIWSLRKISGQKGRSCQTEQSFRSKFTILEPILYWPYGRSFD